MSDYDADKLIKFLNDKWGEGKPCPMCSVSQWNVETRVFQLPEFHKGAVYLGGPVVPVVPVTCANCGNTQFVNAVVADLLPKDEPAATARSG